MNWSRILIAGVAAGVALNISDFVMHGLIMGNTYTKYSVFTQEQASPFLFLVIALCIGIAAAILFAKTRASWAAGAAGGATFGFWLGLVSFFAPFYNSLVFEGFPYYMGWCWGGISLIGAVIGGTVLGLIYKKA
jgi:hypothetical protein